MGSLKVTVQILALRLGQDRYEHSVMYNSLRSSWTAVSHSPLSMEFSRQEYWSGLPFPSPGNLPDPEIKAVPVESPALAGGFFTTEPLGKPKTHDPKPKAHDYIRHKTVLLEGSTFDIH